jgi:hypothetical protein
MDRDLIERFVAALDAAVSVEAAVEVAEAFARADGVVPEDFLNNVALTVGQSFLSGRIDYGDAMGTMAGIYNALFQTRLAGVSTLVYEVYWALDEGEYGHESDGDLNPIQARAIPALRRALTRG